MRTAHHQITGVAAWLAAAAVLAACSDAPTAPADGNRHADRIATVAGIAADGPRLIANTVKYRDAGGHPATGRSGSATLSARALLGIDGATEIEAAAGVLDGSAAASGTLARVQVKAWDARGMQTTRTFAATDAVFRASLDGLARHAPVQVQALVRGTDGRRTDVVTGATEVLLRPNLAVSLVAPPRVEAGTVAPIIATIAERNGDVGARADCVLYVDGSAADRAEGIWVDAGDAVACRFSPRLDAPGTHALQVRLERIDPADFDPSDNAASAEILVLRSGRILYSATAEDRTYTSRLTWRRTYREYGPDSYDLFRTDDQTGHTQASVVYGSFPDRPALPFTADVSQETGGTVLHAGSYASSGSCVSSFETAAGVTLSVCSGASGTSIDYERHTGTVTYQSAESLYRHPNGAMLWLLVYRWTRNRVESAGTTPAYGPDFTVRLTVRDSTAVWRGTPVVSLAPFAESGGRPYECRMYQNPFGSWETYCEGFTSSASGVRGSAASQP